MTNTHATPGPWTVTAGRIILDPHGNMIGHAYARRHIDCGKHELFYGDTIPNVEPTTADRNARLLAAAPELRDALARLVAWIDAGCDPSRRSLETARAILARLEGA